VWADKTYGPVAAGPRLGLDNSVRRTRPRSYSYELKIEVLLRVSELVDFTLKTGTRITSYERIHLPNCSPKSISSLDRTIEKNRDRLSNFGPHFLIVRTKNPTWNDVERSPVEKRSSVPP